MLVSFALSILVLKRSASTLRANDLRRDSWLGVR